MSAGYIRIRVLTLSNSPKGHGFPKKGQCIKVAKRWPEGGKKEAEGQKGGNASQRQKGHPDPDTKIRVYVQVCFNIFLYYTQKINLSNKLLPKIQKIFQTLILFFIKSSQG
ncbi:unnamed protein product [Meloidogyne enterolobii]|uniref:Uncharacterized protein n=1 Tax=Meloidogyne enterolobii TaxID=390850 RepID=A0ACB0ZEB4_MELEN